MIMAMVEGYSTYMGEGERHSVGETGLRGDRLKGLSRLGMGDAFTSGGTPTCFVIKIQPTMIL